MVAIPVAPMHVRTMRVFTHDTLTTAGKSSMHVTGVSVAMDNLHQAPNCLLITLPSQRRARIIDTSQFEEDFMTPITSDLEPLDPLAQTDLVLQPEAFGKHGMLQAFCVDNAQGVFDMLHTLHRDVMPHYTTEFKMKIDMLRQVYPDHSVLAICFSGSIAMEEPVVVSYVPDNDDVLYAPGLVSVHNPLYGVNDACVEVAFSVEESTEGSAVAYPDPSPVDEFWAPRKVVGFHDNRRNTRASSYCVARESVMMSFSGQELLASLIS